MPSCNQCIEKEFCQSSHSTTLPENFPTAGDLHFNLVGVWTTLAKWGHSPAPGWQMCPSPQPTPPPECQVQKKKMETERPQSRVPDEIGWKRVFTGHLSQAWEQLQGDSCKDEKTQRASDWAAAMVTTHLQQAINLWETIDLRCGVAADCKFGHPLHLSEGVPPPARRHSGIL